MKRTATATWLGTGMEGKGTITTQSSVLDETQYSFKSRFETGPGTNPEELIAAAHAGCFSMKLSFVPGEAGYSPEWIETTCENRLANGTIEFSHLVCKAKVPGITNEKLQELAAEAKENCPVSQALNTVITMEATLL